MRRLLLTLALSAALIPVAMPAPVADAAGRKFCLKRNGNHRICIKYGRRFDRICIKFYFPSGTYTRCHRRWH